VQDDTAWLAAQSPAEAQRPRLRGFGSGAGGGGGGAAALDVGAAEAVVERVLQALDSLYTADAASIEESPNPNPHRDPSPNPHPHPHPTPEQESIPRVLATATEGSASSSEAHRRARALAMRAGCEPHITLTLLASLLMTGEGEGELRVLNPLLSPTEAAEVMRDASAVLLTVCRAAHLARTRAVARALAAALGRLKGVRAKQRGAGAAGAGPGGGGEAMAEDAHAAGGARVLAEQLAALLATAFAHVEGLSPSEVGALPALGVGLGGGVAPPTHGLDPRLLCFEFSMGLILRPQQVQRTRTRTRARTLARTLTRTLTLTLSRCSCCASSCQARGPAARSATRC